MTAAGSYFILSYQFEIGFGRLYKQSFTETGTSQLWCNSRTTSKASTGDKTANKVDGWLLFHRLHKAKAEGSDQSSTLKTGHHQAPPTMLTPLGLSQQDNPSAEWISTARCQNQALPPMLLQLLYFITPDEAIRVGGKRCRLKKQLWKSTRDPVLLYRWFHSQALTAGLCPDGCITASSLLVKWVYLEKLDLNSMLKR